MGDRIRFFGRQRGLRVQPVDYWDHSRRRRRKLEWCFVGLAGVIFFAPIVAYVLWRW